MAHDAYDLSSTPPLAYLVYVATFLATVSKYGGGPRWLLQTPNPLLFWIDLLECIRLLEDVTLHYSLYICDQNIIFSVE